MLQTSFCLLSSPCDLNCPIYLLSERNTEQISPLTPHVYLFYLYKCTIFITESCSCGTKYVIVNMYFIAIFVLIQFNVPFKIISLIETSQSIGGAKREYPVKTT